MKKDVINIEFVRGAAGVSEVPDVTGITEVTEVPGVWGTGVSGVLLQWNVPFLTIRPGLTDRTGRNEQYGGQRQHVSSFQDSGSILIFITIFLTFLFLMYGGCTRPARAQDLPDVILNMTDSLEDEDDAAGLIDYVEELLTNPVNVNIATIDQLMMIPGMRPHQAEALVAYRNGNGNFDSEQDLLKVRGIGPASLEQMLPFITVGGYTGRLRRNLTNPNWWVRNGRFESYSRARQNRKTAAGYIPPHDSIPPHYLGSPAHFTQRISYSSRALSLNRTQIKDPGEEGLTYLTAHAAIRDAGPVRMLVAGDYRVASGYGLIFASGAGMGRVPANSSMAPARNNVILHRTGRYQPVQRGVALSIGHRFNITLFTARNELSAAEVVTGDPDDQDPDTNPNTDPNDPETDQNPDQNAGQRPDYIRFPQRGLTSRTELERSRQQNVVERLRGVRAGIQAGPVTIGAVWYEHRFDREVIPGNGLHNRYDFSGTSNAAGGADITFRLNGITLFTEGGMSRNGGKAVLGGFQFRQGNDGYIRLLYRNYGENFQSYYGRSVSTSAGRPRNEEGFFAGAGGRLAGLLLIDGFLDFHRHPGPRFGISSPSSGHERQIGLQAPAGPNWSLTAAAQYRERENGVGLQDVYGRDIRGTSAESRARYYLAANGTGDIIRYRTRLEWVHTRNAAGERANGFALMQDVRWAPARWLRLDARITLFETDGFSSRLYFFEQDVLYSMSLPALYGTGTRSYVLARIRPAKFIELWARIAITRFDDRPVIGSGHDQTTGNTRTTVSGVLRVSF
jgi:competence ComEA-like helix-hairpin-helix protein